MSNIPAEPISLRRVYQGGDAREAAEVKIFEGCDLCLIETHWKGLFQQESLCNMKSEF